jgi:hypothetical protein
VPRLTGGLFVVRVHGDTKTVPRPANSGSGCGAPLSGLSYGSDGCGEALKLEASKIAEIEISAVVRVIWRVQALVECFCCFFIEFLGLSGGIRSEP